MIMDDNKIIEAAKLIANSSAALIVEEMEEKDHGESS